MPMETVADALAGSCTRLGVYAASETMTAGTGMVSSCASLSGWDAAGCNNEMVSIEVNR